jgi:hypothetical protein
MANKYFKSKRELKSEFGFTDYWLNRLGEPDIIKGGAHLYSTIRVITFIQLMVKEYHNLAADFERINKVVKKLWRDRAPKYSIKKWLPQHVPTKSVALWEDWLFDNDDPLAQFRKEMP